MARLGDTFIDINEEPGRLDRTLEQIADISRVALLTVESLCREDKEPDPDLVLLQNMLWPLASLAWTAVKLEREARLGVEVA